MELLSLVLGLALGASLTVTVAPADALLLYGLALGSTHDDPETTESRIWYVPAFSYT